MKIKDKMTFDLWFKEVHAEAVINFGKNNGVKIRNQYEN
jgi:hypothetical protein